MKSIVTIADFLFEHYQELQNKVENDYQIIEDYKREIFTFQFKQDALHVNFTNLITIC